jgi:hypothetical protein
MTAVRILAALVIAAFTASAAYACGHCIEDRMAAVYDHAVLTRASAARHKVAFFAVLGTVPPDYATAQAIRREVEQVPGVNRNSVRYSSELASLSLSFDPGAVRYAALERALNTALAGRGLKLGLINIVDRPSQIRAGRSDTAAAR